MQYNVNSVKEYLSVVPEEKQKIVERLRAVILDNLPEGFEETIQYGMIGYVVPHQTYPSGYHCKPSDPLPFMALASQKNHIGFYHMGLYADKNLLDWFTKEYSLTIKTKLDMGKSCIRFKKEEQIPFRLIGELVSKMNVNEWIQLYEENIKS
ncbi:DUF1801 domain-containing protein [Belliella sp. DSM 107340]|uniref:DUF1801 domain-containing protein n=1 Tax=Belliella calami TaxID=2923436 RepID=A0ABS9UNP7_9BACT|nr:DUF1801 domain-containing protein [Belliella calami]MCH7398241.1 DUF1801 domain-containing protein [Belliella calami]